MRKTAALIIIVGLIFTACGASTRVIEYRTMASLKAGVEGYMSQWADRVVAGKTTPTQEAKVRSAYETYQSAYVMTSNALADQQAPPPQALTDLATKLLTLLAQYGINTGK